MIVFKAIPSALLCAFALAADPPDTAAAIALANAGFEHATPAQDWQTNVYGATPSLAPDPESPPEGQQALRVSSAEPSDTALAQEITLPHSKWHRFSAWVRTRKLDPGSGSVSATLQVQRPEGHGLIASGPSHAGDTDWTRVSVDFRPPPDGRVRLCLFFVGFGKGTGTVWFDDARIEPVELDASPIRIRRDFLAPGTISPMQYGQFVEYLCDLVPALWAEKLYDGSFEGLSPYKFAFVAETDFREKPWYPIGAVNRGRYSPDTDSKVAGNASRRIQAAGPEPCTLGLAQDGLFVDPHQPCLFQVWLRAEGLSTPVRVSLGHEAKRYAACEFVPASNWRKFQARLTPSTRDANATLALEFRGPGTLWIDNASLMPTDTVGGWRRDVVEAVRALRPAVIRFGGSAVDEPGFGDFEWKDTVGDPDQRRPFRAWGGLQPTGPGLAEFVHFCRAVDAEPLLCARFSRRTPRDAADQVEYFNGATNTPMGALRSSHGHPEPYRVKLWQIGNERQSPEYDSQLADFCVAMKTVDPGIRLFSSFPTVAILQRATHCLDYVCPHHYTPDLAACENDLDSIRRLLCDHSPGYPIKVAVTEWNTTAGDWGLGRASLMTLANALACSRYHNLLHRHCDLVEIANRSNLANSFGSGIIQTDNHRLYKTPTYYAQFLYATLAGTRPLGIDPPSMPAAGLDLSATLSPKGDTITLFAVNDGPDDIARTLDFTAWGRRAGKVSVWTLADRDRAGEPDVRNSFADPERVAIRRTQLRPRTLRFDHRFPRYSLTVLSFTVQR